MTGTLGTLDMEGSRVCQVGQASRVCRIKWVWRTMPGMPSAMGMPGTAGTLDRPDMLSLVGLLGMPALPAMQERISAKKKGHITSLPLPNDGVCQYNYSVSYHPGNASKFCYL